MISENYQIREKAQSIVILAIAVVGLVAVMALVIDGGMLYYYRRQAQTAADAGALAGARELCEGELNPAVEAIAEASAISYATSYNHADSVPTIDIDMVNGVVTVNTMITRTTFFAGTLGFPQAQVQAEAAAGCFPGTLGEHVLPIAFACKGTTADPLSDLDGCDLDYLTQIELKEYQDIFDLGLGPVLDDFHHWDLAAGPYPIPQSLLDSEPPKFGAPQGTLFPKELYVIMDSESSFDDMATICIDNPWGLPGEMECDIDGDGMNDFLGSGAKSWLSFDASQGTSDIIDWIINGFPDEIPIHTWYPAFVGTSSDTFATIREHLVGETVLIPIFDGICDVDPLFDSNNPSCVDIVHDLLYPGFTGQDSFVSGGPGKLHYHISGFASFHITCVRSPGKPCPGADFFADEYPCLIDKSCHPGNDYKAIEGYFLSGILPGLGGDGGKDYGTYSLRLIPVNSP